MFIVPEIVLDTRALTRRLARVRDAARALDAQVQRVVLPASQQRTDKTINADPGAHVHRRDEWTSEKQRRWWFAVGVHRWQGRTGAARRWRIELTRGASGGTIQATNPARHARFVFGPYQQKMHRATWMPVDTYKRAESQALAQDVRRAWQDAQRLAP